MPLRYWLCPGLSLDANAVSLRRRALLLWHRGGGNSRNQNCRIDVEATGNLDDVVKAEIARATFDLTDERPVHFRQLCKSFLTDPEPKTLGSNAFAKDSGSLGFGFAHGS